MDELLFLDTVFGHSDVGYRGAGERRMADKRVPLRPAECLVLTLN